jgi:hypothetical protein
MVMVHGKGTGIEGRMVSMVGTGIFSMEEEITLSK